MGKKDFDCENKDYIDTKADFANRVDPHDERPDYEIGPDYDAWIRSDVDDF